LTNNPDELLSNAISLASELEAFEPRLNGFSTAIEGLGAGRSINSAWLDKASGFLQNESVAEIAFSLNALAGTYFSQGDTDGAKRLCQTAYQLYKIALGDNHPDTMVVAENLKKLEQKETPPEGPKLPKLKKFNKPRS